MKNNKIILLLLLATASKFSVAQEEYREASLKDQFIARLVLNTAEILPSAISMAAGMALYFFFQSKMMQNTHFDMVKASTIKESFDSIVGNKEAKKSFQEIISFLKNPKILIERRLKIPSGVLLFGPPGTGKTMLARAVAKQAGCSFIAVNAPELQGLYVSQTSAKIKALFAQARKNKPCIIFIDEIDEIGKSRAIQEKWTEALTQLLVEMDGFNASQGVIVIAATNNHKILDSGLLRRFPRQIEVHNPAQENRQLLFKKTLGNMNFKIEITDKQYELCAEATNGFSNDDITRVCDEIGLYAVRKNKETITYNDLIKFVRNKIITKKPLLGKQSTKITA